jgi:predicted transcriptional regulator
MNVKEDLHRLVDQLADSELETARKILERLHVDLDEGLVFPEELLEIEEGSAQIDRGEYVTLEEVKRKHGS